MIKGYAELYKKQRQETLVKIDQYLEPRPSLSEPKSDHIIEIEGPSFVTAREPSLSLSPPETQTPLFSTPFPNESQKTISFLSATWGISNNTKCNNSNNKT